MTDNLPDPLVPAEVDLREFKYMELDVRVLRDSRFAAQVSSDAFRAGVLLWCAAWHQVPAGSLPDDDIELASLAGYGRFVKEWRKVRDEALTQFTLCSDGRLYHATVCEKALQAWESKLHHHYEKARDRLRKANKVREVQRLAPLQELTFDDWNAQRIGARITVEKANASAGSPQKQVTEKHGNSVENVLKGSGEGTKRRLNRRQRTPAVRFDAAGMSLPDWLDRDVWVQWATDRKDRGNPITEIAAATQISCLAKFRESGHDPVNIIKTSIAGGWSGLFEPTVKRQVNSPKHVDFVTTNYRAGIDDEGSLLPESSR